MEKTLKTVIICFTLVLLALIYKDSYTKGYNKGSSTMFTNVHEMISSCSVPVTADKDGSLTCLVPYKN